MEIVFTDVSRMLFQPGASLPKVPSAESFKDSRLDVFQRLFDEVLIQRPIEVKDVVHLHQFSEISLSPLLMNQDEPLGQVQHWAVRTQLQAIEVQRLHENIVTLER